MVTGSESEEHVGIEKQEEEKSEEEEIENDEEDKE